MIETDECVGNFYTCMVCEKRFRNPVFAIAPCFERTVFFDGNQMLVLHRSYGSCQ